MADKCAKKNGFLCAYYIGRCGDMFVYEPIAKKIEKKIERRFEFPDVITIKNNRVKYHKSFTSIDILAYDRYLVRVIFKDLEIWHSRVPNLSWTHFRTMLRVADERAQICAR